MGLRAPTKVGRCLCTRDLWLKACRCSSAHGRCLGRRGASSCNMECIGRIRLPTVHSSHSYLYIIGSLRVVDVVHSCNVACTACGLSRMLLNVRKADQPVKERSDLLDAYIGVSQKPTRASGGHTVWWWAALPPRQHQP